jgi:hypothetical protein
MEMGETAKEFAMEQGRKQNPKQIDRLLQRIEMGKLAAARKLAIRLH